MLTHVHTLSNCMHTQESQAGLGFQIWQDPVECLLVKKLTCSRGGSVFLLGFLLCFFKPDVSEEKRLLGGEGLQHFLY